jgi:hypothetical protein
VLLGWLYESAASSVLIAGVWHGTYNLTSATAGGSGAVAALVSTGVSIGAVVLAVRHRRVLRPPAQQIGLAGTRGRRWVRTRA